MDSRDNLKSTPARRLLLVSGVCLAALASALAVASAGEKIEVPDSMEVEAVESKVVDGFFIGLSGMAPGANTSTNKTSTDDAIIYVIWTTGNPAWVALPADPEYAFRIELLDTNGLPVPKTEACNSIGINFYEFGPKNKVKVKHYHANRRGRGVALSYLLLPADPRGSPWPDRASDLFKIPGPGRYTLRVWFQILAFPTTGPGRKDYTRDLIRFPPLDYPLVARPKSSTNAANEPGASGQQRTGGPQMLICDPNGR